MADSNSKSGKDNLIPMSQRTPERIKEITTKGAKRCNEVRNQKKELLRLLQLRCNVDWINENMNQAQILEEKRTYNTAQLLDLILISVADQDANNRMKAKELIHKITGELNPRDEKDTQLKKAQIQRLKAETERIKLETELARLNAKLLQEKIDGKNDIEDLTPLAQKLAEIENEEELEDRDYGN